MSMVDNNPGDIVFRVDFDHLVVHEIDTLCVRDFDSVPVVDDVDLTGLIRWTRMVLDVEVV